jgi:molybdopterin-containing oxidoreductase family iron-sulfur binding subunit
MSINRRQFLGFSTAAVAATALAPGLRLIELAQARSPDEAVTALHRWGLLIDASVRMTHPA